MLGSGYDAYQNTAVEAKAAGADIHTLVLMLFDGFLEELDRVAGHIEANRYDKKAVGVEKMMRILGGLEASLDQESGEAVVEQMQQLYQHCGQALLQASLKNDIRYIENVRMIMTNLQEGWQNLGSKAA
ncbi:flagellar export chaperone FliS [Aestuariibacter sp. A3R04]|uniref:flagellar export chaperone FliS n=1 Tax=Aestuariibacter sp. A3R04 TaxID=2841571 RepID=UPI001C09DD56|nr:flagellar export chaperone FliS [Aestuariibacter sp. A3R04]MBU3023132.1 flagellar export chaperone FliS [Aestuariibacter sp. A3R04]